ncbi:hypothetical protein LBMAG42_29510 [Deltaproteobacteria bacterium]|nr:hypothetical protein LBMAG42_29510 [Deltaproteobacteria bacterium]
MSDLSFLDFEGLVTRAVVDPAAEREVHRRFGTSAAILVVDFTGMVRRTDARGIVYALGRARAAEAAMALTGTRVKRVADTVFALYTSPFDALEDALSAHRRLRALMHSSDDPIHACIGLGFGPMLVIPGHDCFGAEVNRAFVLGEDVAKGGETLVTPEFLAAIGSLPEGVGAYRAPEEREAEPGFAFHVVSDYRDAAAAATPG